MTFESIIKFIQRHEKFILTAHETPDGDAIGSEFSMMRALQKLGKTAKVFNSDPMPKNFRFIDVDNEIQVLTEPAQLPGDLDEYALIILDVSDTGNIGNIAEHVLPKVREYFILDHHDNESDILSPSLIQRRASSTAEILYQLFNELGVEIDIDMAHAIFTAVVYDTGSFIYPKTSALTFRIGYELVSFGVNPNRIHHMVYETKSIASLLLQSTVLSSLELRLTNRVAIQTMLRSTLIESGANYEEGHQIINIPLAAESVEVSIFFKENIDGLLRCSLRSKGAVDVAKIARKFGGGGHQTAAGFKFQDSLELVKAKLLKHMESCFSPNKA